MKVKRAVRALGLDPRATIDSARGLREFRANRRAFMAEAEGKSTWEIGDDYPCLADRYDQSGVAAGQYFHQDLWVAQRIHEARPPRHVDVGSRVDGFVAHVASFMPVEVLDIRPLSSTAANLAFARRDIMKPDAEFDDYTPSLSYLHTLEHFGLGRYGDPIDFDGYLKGWENLVRMVAPGGHFYFSVPVSNRQRIEFDAHRLFGVPHLLEMIDPHFEIATAVMVDDRGDLVSDLDMRSAEALRTFDVENGCVIFDLKKRG